MKPHEETWDETYEVTVVGPRLERHEDAARERLARAAPDMARALLSLLGNGHLVNCTAFFGQGECSPNCAAVREALKEAGVLP